MNRTIFRTAGSILAGIVLTGCETYKPYSNPAAPLPTLKRVAIVMPLNSKEKRRRADDISNVLAKRGIEAVIVPESDPIPKDVDGYFTYTDSWQWDLTMYLADIEIKLHDAQTGKVIASARYKQGWIHRYPTPIDIVDNLIGQILGEPPKSAPRAEEPQNNELLKH